MIIVLEGVDTTGKSSVVAELMKKFTDRTLINVRPNLKDTSKEGRNLVKDNYKEELNKAIARLPKITIFDRFWISEQVYSIKRGMDCLKEWSLLQLSYKLRDYPHIVFYLEVENKEVLKKRMLKMREDFIRPAEIEVIESRYDTALKASNLRF